MASKNIQKMFRYNLPINSLQKIFGNLFFYEKNGKSTPGGYSEKGRFFLLNFDSK
jgi:hypothetical protein